MLILLAGDYKSGKTIASCSFIDACKKMEADNVALGGPEETLLMLDINDGFEAVKNARDASEALVVPRWKEIIVEKFYKTGFHPLFMKTAEKADFAKKQAPAHTAQSGAIVESLNTVFNELYDKQGMYKGKKIQVLVIDALSDMFRIWKEAVMDVNKIPNLRISDYLTLEGMLFGQFIPTLKSLGQYIPWIILCNHITMDKDEIMGAIMEFPIGPSNAMGRLIGKEFDEVWKMEASGSKFSWRTKSAGFFKAGSRMSLPDPVTPATYKTLEAILKGRA